MTRTTGFAFFVATALLHGGCGTKSFNHVDPAGSDTFFGEGSFGSSGEDPHEGNFPEPAVTRCGDLPPGIAPVDEMLSAWAVVAVPDATIDGEPVAAGTVQLRISQEGLSQCGAATSSNEEGEISGSGSSSSGDPPSGDTSGSSSGSTSGSSSGDTSGDSSGGTSDGTTGSAVPDPGFEQTGDRTLELMMGPHEMALGTHAVADLVAPGVKLTGSWSTNDFGDQASVELLRVDDDCVVGVLHGFRSSHNTPFLEGGFVAQTCQRQCIPTRNNPC